MCSSDLTGIAHTYMAAEGIEKAAKAKNCFIKIETRGSGGAKNVLTDQEIADADCIIVAADAKVPMERFDGKKVIECQVSDGISKADQLIDRAINGDAPVYHAAAGSQTSSAGNKSGGSVGHKIYMQLMNGVSHMLPLVVGGGILIAIAFLIDGLSVDLSALPADQRANFGTITPVAALFKGIGGTSSGWDYSSRWLRDITRLASIRTTQFIPIDLNAFLFKLENTIANLSGLKGDRETETAFRQKASDRRSAVNRYLWDEEGGCFRDYDWRREQQALFSAASIVALYVGMATHQQAERLADAVRARLLTPGGIMATEYDSGEQWDKPNGWAPLQWMAIQGFKLYGQDPLGDEIAHSWLQTVNHFYKQHHKLIEKYHIAGGVAHEGGGGEYPLQDGFGWTNGVARRLIGLYGEPL